MSNEFVCPIDGSHLILVNNTNVDGDVIHRWECPNNDWVSPWYSRLLSGETEAIPELLRNVVFYGNPVDVTIPDNTVVNVIDDYDSFESFHQNIEANTDTTITFSQTVRLIRVSNWNPDARVLVKNGTIVNNNDSSAARVGKSIATKYPGQMWFPFVTDTIHLRAQSLSEVTVEGYFGNV